MTPRQTAQRGARAAERGNSRTVSTNTSEGAGGISCLSGEQIAASAFVVVLPYPPSVNHLYRRVGNKTLISAEGRRYHELVGTFVRIIRSKGGIVPPPPHRVSMWATPPDKRRRDLDNLLKASLDPTYRAIGYDDSVIEVLSIAWNRDGGDARLEVHIEPLAAADGEGE